jgi:hypothetical protein
MRPVESVQAVAGKGLVGDRHFHPGGAPSGNALTLVEEEVVEDVGLEPGATRLEELTRPGIIKDLAHRGGINVDILSDGTISLGDRLTDAAGTPL